jgi:predicted AAA+ superfamily ATPase
MNNYRKRMLDVSTLLEERSLFLLGPRQTGKSSFVREELKNLPALSYNLLDSNLVFRLTADPSYMRQEIEAKNLKDCVVFIDEIQKCPFLLDEVHLLIEERGIRFLLTGSSVRKLRRAGVNLLGGRARTRAIHPFVYPEIAGSDFSLDRVMECGLIPSHYLSLNPAEDLGAYVNTYLTEEIAAEGAARNLTAFARFLQVAASTNSKILNYTNVAGDAQIPRQTVKLWYQILTDTMLGYELPPYTATTKRKSIETSKFYFFDLGIVKTLRRLPLVVPESSDFGEFFEHFIFMEMRSWIDYRKPDTMLSFWRSKSGFEVDFIMGDKVAVEVKSASVIQSRHLNGLKALMQEGKMSRYILVCREPRQRFIDGILVIPWQDFIEQLWADKFTGDFRDV